MANSTFRRLLFQSFRDRDATQVPGSVYVVTWLVDQRSLQQVDRSPHAFHPREHDILMLDRQPAIVTIETQAITKFPPPLLGVSISIPPGL
jgi:hypothetical protein